MLDCLGRSYLTRARLNVATSVPITFATRIGACRPSAAARRRCRKRRSSRSGWSGRPAAATYRLPVHVDRARPGTLAGALDLHGSDFPQQLAGNADWAGRKVEGLNISNVFKLTFYQIAFRYQVAKRETSVGSALPVPARQDRRRLSGGRWIVICGRARRTTTCLPVRTFGTHPTVTPSPGNSHISSAPPLQSVAVISSR